MPLCFRRSHLAWACSAILMTQAVQAAPVTSMVGSYGGLWQSSTTAISGVIPDDSNLLLAFTVNLGGGTQTFSTGINDAALTTAGITFSPQVFRNLPIGSTPTPTSTTYVGILANWGGTPQDVTGEVPDNPSRPFTYYIEDGTQGLELGTAVFNLPSSGTLVVPINGSLINPAHIGDGIPDIVVTQMGDPGTSDQFRFYDGATPLGTALAVNFSTTPKLGDMNWAFYQASNYARVSRIDGLRSVRIVAFDFADLGITPANAAQITELRQSLSGNSDPAFVAYNVASLPVELPRLAMTKTSSSPTAQPGDTIGYTLQVENQSTVQPSQGTIMVTDTLPTGLTPATAHGTGWTCDIAGQTVTCTYTAALTPAMPSAPPIEITATVDANASGTLTNRAQVSGGGDIACPAEPRCTGQAAITTPSAASAAQAVPTLGGVGLLLSALGLSGLAWRRRLQQGDY